MIERRVRHTERRRTGLGYKADQGVKEWSPGSHTRGGNIGSSERIEIGDNSIQLREKTVKNVNKRKKVKQWQPRPDT